MKTLTILKRDADSYDLKATGESWRWSVDYLKAVATAVDYEERGYEIRWVFNSISLPDPKFA